MANKSESKPRTVLNALVNNTTSYANLDYNYGPYDDVEEAIHVCEKLKAPVGFTCGVLSGSKVIEYQVRSGATEQSLHKFSVGGGKYNQLLLKQETPEPSGSGVNLSLSASRTGDDPENGRPYTTVTIKNNDSTVGSFMVYDGASGTGGSGITLPGRSPYPITSTGTELQASSNIGIDTIVGQYHLTTPNIDTVQDLKIKSQTLYLGPFRKFDNTKTEDENGDFVEIQAQKNVLAILNARVNARDGFYETSDVRLKTDVQTAELDYDQILDKIRPVLYHWKFDQEGPLELGFIAQEIQELVPQVVSGEKQLSVNYAKLSTVALGACKHLMQRLDQLENRVKDIEEKLK